MSRLWITGYRSYELGVFDNKDPKLVVIKSALRRKIIEKVESGVTWIISGPQLGVEQWGLEVANELKDEYPELQTALMFPFADFGNQWQDNKKEALLNLKMEVDFSGLVSEDPYKSPKQLRNYQGFMLNHTDGAVLVYDEEREGKTKYDLDAIRAFQDTKNFGLELIDFFDLEEEANNVSENEQ